MIIPFCPFVNGACNIGCIFNNACTEEGDPENCNLNSAIRAIMALDFEDNLIDKRLQKIITKNESIDSNTSTIYDINEKLESIQRLLEKSKN